MAIWAGVEEHRDGHNRHTEGERARGARRQTVAQRQAPIGALDYRKTSVVGGVLAGLADVTRKRWRRVDASWVVWCGV